MEQLKRIKRTKLLKAFDIHKTNVSYGICTETEQEHTNIVNWHKDLLDLKNNAFLNIPSAIAKHLPSDYELPNGASYVIYDNGVEKYITEDNFKDYLIDNQNASNSELEAN